MDSELAGISKKRIRRSQWIWKHSREGSKLCSAAFPTRAPLRTCLRAFIRANLAFPVGEMHDVLLVMYDHRTRVFQRPHCPQSRDDAFLFPTRCSISWIGLELRLFAIPFFFVHTSLSDTVERYDTIAWTDGRAGGLPWRATDNPSCILHFASFLENDFFRIPPTYLGITTGNSSPGFASFVASGCRWIGT